MTNDHNANGPLVTIRCRWISLFPSCHSYLSLVTGVRSPLRLQWPRGRTTNILERRTTSSRWWSLDSHFLFSLTLFGSLVALSSVFQLFSQLLCVSGDAAGERSAGMAYSHQAVKFSSLGIYGFRRNQDEPGRIRTHPLNSAENLLLARPKKGLQVFVEILGVRCKRWAIACPMTRSQWQCDSEQLQYQYQEE